jgi:hypothetical protein
MNHAARGTDRGGSVVVVMRTTVVQAPQLVEGGPLKAVVRENSGWGGRPILPTCTLPRSLRNDRNSKTLQPRAAKPSRLPSSTSGGRVILRDPGSNPRGQ